MKKLSEALKEVENPTGLSVWYEIETEEISGSYCGSNCVRRFLENYKDIQDYTNYRLWVHTDKTIHLDLY